MAKIIDKRLEAVENEICGWSESRDDWAQLQELISLVYNAGVNAGSEKRAAEIREALGLPVVK